LNALCASTTEFDGGAALTSLGYADEEGNPRPRAASGTREGLKLDLGDSSIALVGEADYMTVKNVEKVADDLYLIKQPLRDVFTGVTVIIGRNSVGVVDTGLETTPTEYVFPLLLGLGHELGKIDYVVNTHSHGDHIWGNRALKEKTNAKVAVHELDADAVGMVDLKMKDGHTIKLGDRLFRVVHTPGHTAGSICLHDEKGKTLLTGDSVQGRGVEEGKILVRAAKEEYVQSMKKLLTLNVGTLIQSHPYRPFRKAVLTGEEPRQTILESIKAAEAQAK